MTGELITEADKAYFRARYPKTWAQLLDYAAKTATEYAERHAPPCVRYQVAQLHLRNVMENDYGDKQLIRRAIDEVILQGRYVDAHNLP